MAEPTATDTAYRATSYQWHPDDLAPGDMFQPLHIEYKTPMLRRSNVNQRAEHLASRHQELRDCICAAPQVDQAAWIVPQWFVVSPPLENKNRNEQGTNTKAPKNNEQGNMKGRELIKRTRAPPPKEYVRMPADDPRPSPLSGKDVKKKKRGWKGWTIGPDVDPAGSHDLRSDDEAEADTKATCKVIDFLRAKF